MLSKLTPQHLSSVCRLLNDCGLPVDDITSEKLNNFYSYTLRNTLIGVIGFENRGSVALLRSLAVKQSHRQQGIGKQLLSHLEVQAADQGINTLYLLTETAQNYFIKNGFVTVDRQTAPTVIKQTDAFRAICPQHAILMKKDLKNDI